MSNPTPIVNGSTRKTRNHLLSKIRAWFVLVVEKLQRTVEHPLSYLNSYSTALVALATIALVVVTWMYVREAERMRALTGDMLKNSNLQLEEAKKMREETHGMAVATFEMAEETRKLSALSIEQFRIRSFPALDIRIAGLDVTAGLITTHTSISNEAEVAALEVRVLQAYAFEAENSKHEFIPLLSGKYESAGGKTVEGKSTFDHETKLPAEKHFGLIHSMVLDKTNPLSKLRHYVVLASFKVPYASKNDYESAVFRLVKMPDGKSYVWSPLEKGEAAEIIGELVGYVRSQPDIRVHDYRIEDGKANDHPLLVTLRRSSKRIAQLKSFLKDF